MPCGLFRIKQFSGDTEYLGGFASYGQILKMAIVIGIISAIIGAIYTYLLYGILDPDLIDKVRIAAEERI